MSAEQKALNRLRVVLLERLVRAEGRIKRAVRKQHYSTAAAIEQEKAGIAWAIADLDDVKATF